ncbi:MAG: SDR family NAD(P)-dependent oxidoreductase [Prevotella sp.]|nr:SDR family NAD(P)-dependent oxidoreductase [Candidatus Equicola stercoris]
MQKKAIVLGATSGIGLKVVKQLSSQGWNVGVAGRRIERLKEIEDSIEGVTAIEQIDITKDDASQKLLTLIEKMGGIDLYFHSSGIGFQNVSLQQDKEIDTMQTNALGFTRMMDTAFNYFAEKGGGHIAVISSIAGTKGLGAAPAYSATKRFQRHYIESLLQLAHIRKLNIIFTDIRPGFVTTDLIKDSDFPMQLHPTIVAKQIVKAIEKRKSVVTIDWRYRILVFFWKLIPRWMWVRMQIR